MKYIIGTADRAAQKNQCRPLWDLLFAAKFSGVPVATIWHRRRGATWVASDDSETK